MNLVRSAPAPQCKLGAREQLNQLTAYIDGNNIYGSDLQHSTSLRSQNGRLLTSTVNDQPYLPFDNGTNICSIPNQDQFKCFVAGDSRVNVQTGLTVMHTIWLREHNRIAEELQKLNPKWSDEILYQETRRIVIAELQNIIYKEFLPILIGTNTMRTFNLTLRRGGYSNSYSPDINVGISSAFATAAYRLHTLVQGSFNLMSQNNKVVQSVQLRTQFNNPSIIYGTNVLELMIGGLTGKPSQKGIEELVLKIFGPLIIFRKKTSNLYKCFKPVSYGTNLSVLK